MPSKLHVFDFDGTLFDSPCDTPENRKRFEKHTGTPWLVNKADSVALSKKLGRTVPIRRGWWGRIETLQPPLVPDPAPAKLFRTEIVEAWHASKADDEAVTVLLTGRHAGMKGAVCRILHQGGLINFDKKGDFYKHADDRCYFHCLGEDGPMHGTKKPNQTFDWKVWMIGQFLTKFGSEMPVEIWEDRIEHVGKFRELNGQLAREIVVNHV